ncbi:bacteriophage T4 gp5 trimerisation domain-containing protein, partial [Pseudomonas koreensis]|nr:hypothetical protein [Pseudomonas koreensis]
KGAEQIYLHAQRDWDENIEHDQKIRVGNERHDTVEANVLSEFKVEEHRITYLDRKSEMRADDHLTVGVTQHVKVGTAQFVEAGTEIHYHAGDKVVVEGAMELTTKAGGSFIKVDVGGVTISGSEVKVNSGGGPGAGSGIAIKLPTPVTPADTDAAGKTLGIAPLNTPLPAASLATPKTASTPTSAQTRLAQQNLQAKTLVAAAKSGVPFCEVCNK